MIYSPSAGLLAQYNVPSLVGFRQPTTKRIQAQIQFGYDFVQSGSMPKHQSASSKEMMGHLATIASKGQLLM